MTNLRPRGVGAGGCDRYIPRTHTDDEASGPSYHSAVRKRPDQLKNRRKSADIRTDMQSKKRLSAPDPVDDEQPADPNLRIYVKRGAIRRFARLTRDSRLLPVAIEWDRREKERRAERESTPQEQRKSERRRKPPFTWEMADFVVTESKGAAKKKKK
jgi:hypothetical protein